MIQTCIFRTRSAIAAPWTDLSLMPRRRDEIFTRHFNVLLDCRMRFDGLVNITVNFHSPALCKMNIQSLR